MGTADSRNNSVASQAWVLFALEVLGRRGQQTQDAQETSRDQTPKDSQLTKVVPPNCGVPNTRTYAILQSQLKFEPQYEKHLLPSELLGQHVNFTNSDISEARLAECRFFDVVFRWSIAAIAAHVKAPPIVHNSC